VEPQIHQRVHAWSDGSREPSALGGKQNAKRVNDGKARCLSESPRRPFIQNHPLGADFEGKTDGFALSWPERGTKYLRAYRLSEGAFADPSRQCYRRSYPSNNGGWDQSSGKKTFYKPRWPISSRPINGLAFEMTGAELIAFRSVFVLPLIFGHSKVGDAQTRGILDKLHT
jgi:hypothetical protein